MLKIQNMDILDKTVKMATATSHAQQQVEDGQRKGTEINVCAQEGTRRHPRAAFVIPAPVRPAPAFGHTMTYTAVCSHYRT